MKASDRSTKTSLAYLLHSKQGKQGFHFLVNETNLNFFCSHIDKERKSIYINILTGQQFLTPTRIFLKPPGCFSLKMSVRSGKFRLR